MNIQNIKKILKKHNPENVDIFTSYINQLATEKKAGKLKNPWINYKTDEQLCAMFKQVDKDGLIFDGKAVSLQNTGVSYSYVAYKNKMLLCYPETVLDLQMVYKDDTFKFEKKNGHILYEHIITNAFSREEKDILGGYCIIKNKRGEFLTLLTKSELEKHRQVAKTDYIWKAWPIEMYFKTLIKKACKQHFQDIFVNIETIDNEANYDITLPLGIDLKVKGEIEAITKVAVLEKYYHDNKEANKLHIKDFNQLVTRQKTFIMEAEKETGEVI